MPFLKISYRKKLVWKQKQKILSFVDNELNTFMNFSQRKLLSDLGLDFGKMSSNLKLKFCFFGQHFFYEILLLEKVYKITIYYSVKRSSLLDCSEDINFADLVISNSSR